MNDDLEDQGIPSEFHIHKCPQVHNPQHPSTTNN